MLRHAAHHHHHGDEATGRRLLGARSAASLSLSLPLFVSLLALHLHPLSPLRCSPLFSPSPFPFCLPSFTSSALPSRCPFHYLLFFTPLPLPSSCTHSRLSPHCPSTYIPLFPLLSLSHSIIFPLLRHYSFSFLLCCQMLPTLPQLFYPRGLS